jgi:hypothetical protein
MPMALWLGPTCSGAARGSVERIDGDAFKIPTVARFPTAMATPYHVHKTEVSDNTRHGRP